MCIVSIVVNSIISVLWFICVIIYSLILNKYNFQYENERY